MTDVSDFESFVLGVMEASADAVLLVDPAGRIVLANGCAQTLFGYAADELVGRPVEDLVPQTVRAQHAGERSEYMQAPAVRHMGVRRELAAQRRDGALLPIEVALSPVAMNGATLVLCIVRDASERRAHEVRMRQLNTELEKRVEERTAGLRAANRELEMLTASLAHDLRAPLRAINGFAARVAQHARSRLEEEDRRLLGVIQQRSLQMSSMLDDYLRLANVRSSTLSLQSLDMDALARDAWNEAIHALDHRAPAFRLESLPQARGDSRLVAKIWRELLGNAVKFTRAATEPRVEVSAQRDGDRVTYTIVDNGVGFDPVFAHKLFGVFERLHAAHEYPGNGVGLVLVGRILERLSGGIRVTAPPGGGAMVQFDLPAADG